jgi:1,4-dihydroxy-2-naphthoyl-CoA synthase
MLKPLKEQTEFALLSALPISLPRIRSSSLFKTSYLSDNAETDHQHGFENWSAVRMFWAPEEAEEAKKAFAGKTKLDFSRFR